MTTNTGAEFSDCLRYRYYLWRIWDNRPLVNFLMLNPSTADDVTNDPTVARCQERATRWGYGGVIVTNIFAWRSTDPAALYGVEDPIGIKNNLAIVRAAGESQIVVCAWGQHGSLHGRSQQVQKLLRRLCSPKMHYLKQSKNGEPGHPLYIPYSVLPVPWK